MRKIISYPISEKSPGWPGNPTYRTEQVTDIKKGDSANTYMIHLFNHFGTHLDAPLHFYEKGLPVCQLPIDEFIYEKPLLLDIPKQAGEKILVEELASYEEKLKTCDLLMIRTGFSKMRAENPQLYAQNGPAVSSSAARYLMENYAGQMKALALDFISLASYSDCVDGDQAHRYLCGKFHQGHICIIEDVNMDGLDGDGICRAQAIPLYLEGVDSSPVTMWVDME